MLTGSFRRLPQAIAVGVSAALALCASPVAAGPRIHPPTLHRSAPLRRPAPPKPPSAADLFVRVLRADDLYTYRGRQTTIYWTTGRNAAVEVFHRPLEFLRIYYLDPESQHGRLIVSDGRQEWQYDPRQSEIRHRLLSAGALDDDDLLSYTLLRANYLLTVDPVSHMYLDRKVWVVTIKRPRDLTLARRFWIDAGSGLILKREIYRDDGRQDSGRPAVTVAFTDITFHPKPAIGSGDLSSLAASSGGRIRFLETPSAPEAPLSVADARAQLGGQAYAPPVLAGYRLMGASATVVGHRPLLHLRYSDGLNLVSLFEQRRTQAQRPTLAPAGMRATRIGPVQGHVSRRASLTTINWDTKTLNVTLMGEMGMDTLRTLALAAIKGR